MGLVYIAGLRSDALQEGHDQTERRGPCTRPNWRNRCRSAPSERRGTGPCRMSEFAVTERRANRTPLSLLRHRAHKRVPRPGPGSLQLLAPPSKRLAASSTSCLPEIATHWLQSKPVAQPHIYNTASTVSSDATRHRRTTAMSSANAHKREPTKHGNCTTRRIKESKLRAKSDPDNGQPCLIPESNARRPTVELSFKAEPETFAESRDIWKQELQCSDHSAADRSRHAAPGSDLGGNPQFPHNIRSSMGLCMFRCALSGCRPGQVPGGRRRAARMGSPRGLSKRVGQADSLAETC